MNKNVTVKNIINDNLGGEIIMKNITENDKPKSNNRISDIVRTNIAIDIGANGLSIPQCADKYGIARQSINRWLRNDREFVSDVERYKNDAVNEKIDAINRMMLGVIDDQVQNVINLSKDTNVPPSTRLDASKFLINKFIPDKPKQQTIRNQNNTQINIENNTNNKNIEEILKSLDDNIIDTTNKDDDF